jgi:GST-like protein
VQDRPAPAALSSKIASSDKPAPWRVFAVRGWGSVIAEAVLTVAGIPFERDEADPSVPGPGRDRLLAANPLGQLPTVVLPDGTILTESAAIVLRAADLAPHAGLAPLPDEPGRTAFLRWLVFLVAALYPTFTYGDDPKRWVQTGSDELRRSTDDHRKTLWQQLESIAGAPWLLGESFSALDIYVCAMSRWRPGRAWFSEHCPRLLTIAQAVDRRPDLAPVWAANFDS